MVWLVVGIVIGVALLIDAAVHAFSIKMILPIFERAPMFHTPKFSPDPRAEVFDIPTTNGLTLSACLFQRSETESRGLIIFCPEFGSTKWACMSYCEGLWEAGFDILAFDFRNSGESAFQGDYHPIHWVTEFERQDVLAVVNYVRQRPDLRERPIGLYGISRGAGAAITAGTPCKDVELIVTDSVFDPNPMMMHFTRRWYSLYVPDWVMKLVPKWHLRFTMWLVRYMSQRRRGCRYVSVIGTFRSSRPARKILMISGLADSFVNGTVAREIANSAGEALEELWLIPKCKHNAARQMNPEQYDARLVQFFSAMSPLHEEPVPPLQTTVS